VTYAVNALGQRVRKTVGANLPNDNPAGLGAFAFNLRFPGQYFDTETATH